MEEMSFAEFTQVLILTGVLDENQPGKWEDILNKLSAYYYYLADEIREKLPQTAAYYTEMGDKLFNYLYDRRYYD